MYATAAQLAEYTGQPAPADADRLLRRASELIDATVTAGYPVDNAGLPTENTVSVALRDAVCAQVEHWQNTGGEHDGMQGFTSVSIGSATLSTAAGAGRAASRQRVAPRAVDHLRTAGLVGGAVPAWA